MVSRSASFVKSNLCAMVMHFGRSTTLCQSHSTLIRKRGELVYVAMNAKLINAIQVAYRLTLRWENCCQLSNCL